MRHDLTRTRRQILWEIKAFLGDERLPTDIALDQAREVADSSPRMTRLLAELDSLKGPTAGRGRK